MARVSCLAGLARDTLALFTKVLKAAGFPEPAVVARLDVVELGNLKPDVLICDVDNLRVDALEFLRQLRFVVPDCIIVVYTAVMTRARSVECHLAGANGLLAASSTNAPLYRVCGARYAQAAFPIRV
jgi:DNA-binding NarL/FixJ family response regulator